MACAFVAVITVSFLAAIGWFTSTGRSENADGPLEPIAIWALFSVWTYASILPHELAHALAAWLVGFEVWRIRFGRGRRILSTKIGTLALEWHAVPTVGHVLVLSERRTGYRWRKFVIIAAGPVANLLIASLGLVILVTKSSSIGDTSDRPLLPWLMLVLANVVLTMNSLLKRKPIDTGSDVVDPDGRKLVKLLRKPTLSTEQSLDYRRRFRAILLISRGRFESAAAIIPQLLRRPNNDSGLQFLEASIAFGRGEFERARTMLRAQLRQDSFAGKSRALLCNFLAWTDLMLQTPPMLDEADSMSAEAFGMLPWEASIQSTRGLVLVERGKASQALPLLRTAWRQADTDNSRAATLCSIAMAMHQLGSHRRAQRMLRRAKRIDPGCELLTRAESVIRPNNHNSGKLVTRPSREDLIGRIV